MMALTSEVRGCWYQPERASERSFRQLAEHSPGPVCVHDGEVLLYVNPAFVAWMTAESDAQLVGRDLAEFVRPDAVDGIRARIAALRKLGEASAPSAGVMLRLDGTAIEATAVAVRIRWQNRTAFQVIFQDVTAQRTAEDLRYRVDPAGITAAGGVVHTLHHAADGTALTARVSAAAMDTGYVMVCADLTALRRAEQHFHTVVASMDAGVVILGADGRPEMANPAAENILGTRVDELLGVYQVARVVDIPLYEPDERRLSGDEHPIVQTLKTGVALSGRILGFDRIDGRRVWLSGSCRLLDPADPPHSSVIITLHDITDQHVARQHLTYQATHDALTGLPNRTHILSCITALTHPSNGRRLGAVLFLDLDNLKIINDTLGHAAGDDVLRLAAQRLRHALDPEDIVGRWGGDEFVILLFGDLTHIDVDRQARALHNTLSAPMNLQETTLHIHASIGSTLIRPDEQRSPTDILRLADHNMYRTKKRNQGSTRAKEQ